MADHPQGALRSFLRPRTRIKKVADVIDDRYARLALRLPPSEPRSVLVVGIYRDDRLMAELIDELRRSRHRVTVNLGALGPASDLLRDITGRDGQTRGKFQNINELIPADHRPDWLIVVDDDISVRPGFLDDFLTLCEHFDFALAQPAQDRGSHANWKAAKRHFLTAARSTRFVEIGPLTALRRDAQELLLPFPEDLRFGWGLDFNWAATMEEAGLSMGVVDALPVTHASRPVAATYSWQAAQDEGRAFLETVPHLPPSVAQESGRRHRLPR